MRLRKLGLLPRIHSVGITEAQPKLGIPAEIVSVVSNEAEKLKLIRRVPTSKHLVDWLVELQALIKQSIKKRAPFSAAQRKRLHQMSTDTFVAFVRDNLLQVCVLNLHILWTDAVEAMLAPQGPSWSDVHQQWSAFLLALTNLASRGTAGTADAADAADTAAKSLRADEMRKVCRAV